MKDFLRSTKAKILIAILAVLLGFMIAGIYNDGSASFFSNIISTVTVPLQKVSSSISNSVSTWFQKHTDAEALYEENQRLQREVQELQDKLVDYDTMKHENEQYSQIIHVAKDRDDWKLQPASVIARDAQNRFYSFTVDKGTIHGVSYLDPVISGDGLVGYVAEVGTNYAKVLTILDMKVDVGAYDTSVRDIGVVTGSVELAAEGLCAMEYLPRDSKVKAGDLILTSGSLTGGTSIYPRDILIGTVEKVEADSHGTNLHAIIKPGVDVATVKDVVIITDFEGKGSSMIDTK